MPGHLLLVATSSKEVNPIETGRKRLRKAHPDKSDPEDALTISKVLITEFDKLPTIQSLDEVYLAIHQLSNRRDSFSQRTDQNQE